MATVQQGFTAMEIKFFAKDVIGKQPQKVGDTFSAKFMGGKRKFKVTALSHGCIMAEMA